jgi:hypothetical protein
MKNQALRNQATLPTCVHELGPDRSQVKPRWASMHARALPTTPVASLTEWLPPGTIVTRSFGWGPQFLYCHERRFQVRYKTL